MAPYQAPEKKIQKKNKGAKDSPRFKGTPDAVSGETNTHSSEEDEDKEGEEASLLAAIAQAAKVSDLKCKLGLADEDLVRINKRLDEAQDFVSKLMCGYGELTEAKEQARVNKGTVDKAAEDLKSERVVRCQYEERVTEVEQALKDAADKYKSIEEKSKAQVTDLAQALKEAEEARVESCVAREEIQQAEQRAADVFADLPKSTADAAQFFRAQEDTRRRSYSGHSSRRGSAQRC
nr:uncharacterized protein LOC120972639 [Aegilops tauschii subsp. strangulata]